jgi:hypothetical protein
MASLDLYFLLNNKKNVNLVTEVESGKEGNKVFERQNHGRVRVYIQWCDDCKIQVVKQGICFFCLFHSTA